jgi:nitrogen fixation/metabolism regulation signal transduction histidine kinase
VPGRETMTPEFTTRFAPPQRSDETTVRAEYELVRAHFELVFNAISAAAAVLNGNRQVIYANRGFMEMTGVSDITRLLGGRPGEILKCIHAGEEAGGCGTSASCRVCGAVKAVLACQSARAPSSEECRMNAEAQGGTRALNLRIAVSPFTVQGSDFSVLTLSDIGPQKRRDNLERVFFHDILNTVNTLKSAINLAQMPESADQREEFLGIAHKVCDGLADEIISHRMLLDAENRRLSLQLGTFQAHDLVCRAAEGINITAQPGEKRIAVDIPEEDTVILCDRTLVKRILINMLKNALEATRAPGMVHIGFQRKNGTIVFRVHNEGCMPPDVQLQVFQRSFSTKGLNRGFGTYGMKLLAEHYLGGRVYFESSGETGTDFYLEIPVDFTGASRS